MAITYIRWASSTEPPTPPSGKIYSYYDPADSTWKYKRDDGSIIIPGSSNALTSAHIYVGNASNIATDVALSGEATLTNAGVLTIAANAIDNGKVSTTAAIAFSKLASLASGNILVGSAGNVPTSVAMSGDISLTNAGVTAYSNTVPILKGGSGQTTANAALNAFLPSQTSNANKLLTTDGSNSSWTSISSAMVTTQAVAGNTTITDDSKNLVLLINSSSAWTITLPNPANNTNRVIYFKDTLGTANTNNITIARFGSEKLENLTASYIMNTSYGNTELITNGTDWFII